MNTHILPFLWVHGENETTYREMIKAIYDANIRAFCVESRTHENFCRDQWWHDMDVILDEAERRGMKVWILDDKHFPTGYANGGLEGALLSQHRRSLFHTTVKARAGKTLKLKLAPYIEYNEKRAAAQASAAYTGKTAGKIDADELVSVSAIGFLPNGQKKILNLSSYILDGILCWTAPEGSWTVEICSSTLNAGKQRDHINLMNKASCRILLDRVYEPHYEHYKDKFGTVIAGFFSDEPGLGNGSFLKHGNILGTEQDLPYSDELEERLEKTLGAGWKANLPLLWRKDYDASETAHIRYAYMDAVTRLVEEDFSRQIGSWCRERGVEYIGHVIEDNNQHARTGTSLGHYFRGLKWQSMAGIDDIGGQVYPQGEELSVKSIAGNLSDGEFYHFALGKLGASLGALNPNMQGRALCEIFGNYGWQEGVRLEKYLVDHFMVRGINYFVPHAFTGKSFPDPDCPPHFYAHGFNPQYRHFGKLMEYTERVSSLISGGEALAPVGILYHGEAEWAGRCMLMQKPARVLTTHQTDFFFVPSDVFEEPDFYRTDLSEGLTVNGHRFSMLVIPYAQFITRQAAEGIAALLAKGFPVFFIDALPDGISNGEEARLSLPTELSACPVITLEELAGKADALRTVRLEPAAERMRALRYTSDLDFLYLFNEDSVPYEGTVELEGPAYLYNPWDDRCETLELSDGRARISLDPSESAFIIFGKAETVLSERALLAEAKEKGECRPITEFSVSSVTSKNYPAFGPDRQIKAGEGGAFVGYQAFEPGFDGIVRYCTLFDYEQGEVDLEITDAYEGVEVFVNGLSLGIQVIPGYRYRLTDCCRKGRNELIIEVATTLERTGPVLQSSSYPGKTGKTGITGAVNLYFTK